MYADSGGHRVLEESLESRYEIKKTQKSPFFNSFTYSCVIEWQHVRHNSFFEIKG